MKEKSSSQEKTSLREAVLQFASSHHGTLPEYLWAKHPRYAVLRHVENRKWYGVILDVPRKRLGLSGEGPVDILDIKCDPVLGSSLRATPGFLPAYHMHKESWLTVLLDGTVELETILGLLEMSHGLTAGSQTKRPAEPGLQKAWLVPANPKYYDIETAFSRKKEIRWKQSSHIAVGDLVYVYVAAPVSAILYKCQAVEVDIPYHFDNGKVRMSHVMKLKRLEQYAPSLLPWEKIKNLGVSSIRGPRSMPDQLLRQMEAEQIP